MKHNARRRKDPQQPQQGQQAGEQDSEDESEHGSGGRQRSSRKARRDGERRGASSSQLDSGAQGEPSASEPGQPPDPDLAQMLSYLAADQDVQRQLGPRLLQVRGARGRGGAAGGLGRRAWLQGLEHARANVRV